MKKPKPTLIWRIAIFVVFVEMVAFGALGLFYTMRFSHSITADTESRIRSFGQMLTNAELPITIFGDKAMLGNLIGAPCIRARVVGGSGLVVVSTRLAELGERAGKLPGIKPAWLAPKGPAVSLVVHSDTLTAVLRVGGRGDVVPVYIAMLTISTAKDAAMRHHIALIGMLGSLLFILLSSLGVVAVMHKLIATRVGDTLTVLKEVEGGKLDSRVAVSGADEISQLQVGINSMTDKLGGLLEQQRRAAGELRHQKELLDSVIQAAPVRVFWKNLGLRYLGCNDLFARDAGLTHAADVVGKSDFQLPWRDQAELYRADDLEVMRTKTPKLDFEEQQSTADGRTIWLRTSKVPLYGEDGDLMGMLGVYSDVTERKNAVEQIRHLAYFDTLTGLANRYHFGERLQRAVLDSGKSGQYGALFILDLDDFKDLNDSHGHDVGDQLIAAVGRQLVAAAPSAENVARIGGDEFVVIVESLGGDRAAAEKRTMAIGDALRRALMKPYALADGKLQHYTTVSIGATLVSGQTTEAGTLLKQADVALYQAKKSGRNLVRFFDAAMQIAIEDRVRLADGLRKGIDRGELRLFFQPQVGAGGDLAGAEALARWFPSDGEPVSPALFIPLAEETGMIHDIGTWVIEQACAQLGRWQSEPATRALVLGVNVSAHQFRQPDLVERIGAAIAAAGIDPKRLKLEITESVLLGDVEAVIAAMHRLKGLGVKFSLDDFGTGYSSLSYLKRLPIDEIKIDQSFVRDITDQDGDTTVVRAIIAMGRSLGMEVIAEGVETKAQHDFLLRHGCERFQGFLFGKPLPMADWDARLFETGGVTDAT